MLFRSIGLTQEDLNEIKQANIIKRDAAPNQDGFLMRAFNQNIESAESAYASPFIDGIRTGQLNPDRYGSVLVMDAFYCYEAAKSIWEVCKKTHTTDPQLYALQSKLYNGYTKYNSTFYEHWHILTSKSVSPTDNFRAYAEHERNVALNEDPIYLFPALLPCYYLWYWMANKIANDPSAAPGIYNGWVECNNYEPHSAYLIDDLITQWISDGREWNEEKAMGIFSKSMEFENKVFNECGYREVKKG